ncbi:unnamed protein product [Somion occarium]|uniref:F-box domain-containing protein n=1 Tax=Somion occarium TaxID=3059160 RepID=A0ABP1DSU6_9APHY
MLSFNKVPKVGVDESGLCDSANLGPSVHSPVSAVHRVLLCDELLTHILAVYDVFESPPINRSLEANSRRELALLARVCKVISEVALNILWRCLDEPYPLISLLRISQDDAEESSIVPPRFLYYGTRIRILNAGAEYIVVWLIRNVKQMTSRPFPRLTRLIVNTDPLDHVSDVQLFIVPSLRSLTLTLCPRENPALSGLLDTIHRTAPYIDELQLEWHKYVLMRTVDVCEVLRGIIKFQHLRKLSTDLEISVYPGLIKTLSKLPTLQSLEFKSYVSDTRNISWNFFASSTGIAALRSITLYGSLPMILALLPALHRCSIVTCNIIIEDTLEAIVDGCHRDRQPQLAHDIVSLSSTLQSLVLQTEEPRRTHFQPQYPYRILRADFIQEFLGTRLLDVELMYIDGDDITDSLCHAMSLAWPELRILRLESSSPLTGPPAHMVTLTGLKYFALYCPDLRSITMQVNGTGNKWQDEIDATVHFNATTLENLNLNGSLVDSPRPVAMFLRWCFPGVRNIESRCRDTFEVRDLTAQRAWDEVVSLVQDYRLSSEQAI